MNKIKEEVTDEEIKKLICCERRAISDKEATDEEIKKLRHYAGKKLKGFLQFDGFFVGKDSGDSVMKPDPDGDWISWGSTDELMMGATVRILIDPNTDVATATRIITKLLDNISRSNHIHNCNGCGRAIDEGTFEEFNGFCVGCYESDKEEREQIAREEEENI